MIFYFPFKQQLFRADIGSYVSYGIAAVRFTRFHCVRAAIAEDVSPSAHKVLCLALRCTRGQLDPIHLMDVVEDSLC